MCDSLILCTFPMHAVYDRQMMAQARSGIFSKQWTTEELKEIGERVMCQERLFNARNAREGLTREDDSLPDRLLIEPKPDRPMSGAVVPPEALKDDFYQAMEYDLETGNPTPALMERLSIEPSVSYT